MVAGASVSPTAAKDDEVLLPNINNRLDDSAGRIDRDDSADKTDRDDDAIDAEGRVDALKDDVTYRLSSVCGGC